MVITALIHSGLGTHLIAGEVLAGASVHFILLLLFLEGPGCAAPVVITRRLAILVDVIKDQVPHLLQLASGDIHRFVHNAPAQKGCAGRLRQAALIAYICLFWCHHYVFRNGKEDKGENGFICNVYEMA